MVALIDIEGLRFGRLVAVSRAESRSGRARWNCVCDCGGTAVASSQDLRTRHTRSCGCHRLENLRRANFQHGRSKDPIHGIWRGILKRCTNPNSHAYPHYGGRGIKVCDRWLNFVHFLADMGERPTSDHTVERLDVDGDYCPENCTWVPRADQARNTRSNRRISIAGETLPLAVWCRRYGAPYGRTRDRIALLGWDAERALTTPNTITYRETNNA